MAELTPEDIDAMRRAAEELKQLERDKAAWALRQRLNEEDEKKGKLK